MSSACLFDEMPVQDRVDFFQKCQEMMVKSYGGNHFLLHSKNKNEILSFYKKLVLNYKGYCYSSDKICILFNVINSSPSNEEITNSSWRGPPIKDGDIYFVDYVVGSINQDTYQELKGVMNFPGVNKISFLRNGHLSVFELDKFEKTLTLGLQRGTLDKLS